MKKKKKKQNERKNKERQREEKLHTYELSFCNNQSNST
jgi:hypothetical protein